ncbi:hypothetical protein MPTK1_7g06970 [Marchantia polymorpha subsp. ruderalis]|uniref:Uncharacterized protein n=2 Tax=Marchantia polymorpha TaxID=3197 RepID=A0AAF6BWX8_MARPO|nr:hypothetical protein MARPO_0076s0097 [Marchantia polymorpha]BBN16512.1 hypothetical protein Mp_7g06970 [Marchantia polymorpha subsp. ruderalis]|eukprot:PTQ34866.1 hypothetical protein MARPO_0076s0097 [Marchantia polymorpha]
MRCSFNSTKYQIRDLICDIRCYQILVEPILYRPGKTRFRVGFGLEGCTRPENNKGSIQIRVAVLAEPTDILGNIRITPGLFTTSVSRLDRSETSKPSSAIR